jgi:hypothetical protein
MRMRLFAVLIGYWVVSGGGTSVGTGIAASYAFDEYCGDEICQEDPCSSFTEPTPGNGCQEDAVSCPEDCGYCGDDYCSVEIGETVQTCIEDCGYCGDGICFQPEETAPGNHCSDDCGPPPSVPCNQCSENADCGSGEVCNAQRCCAVQSPPIGNPPACGGTCEDHGDCCGGDICISDNPFEGKCGQPNDAVCPNAPSCSTDEHCDPVVTGGVPDKYCDPHLLRCVYTLSSECVPAALCPLED